MNTLFLIDVIMWMFLVCFGFIIFTIIGEAIAKKLPDTNKFKKWWRKHMVSDYPYDSY